MALRLRRAKGLSTEEAQNSLLVFDDVSPRYFAPRASRRAG